VGPADHLPPAKDKAVRRALKRLLTLESMMNDMTGVDMRGGKGKGWVGKRHRRQQAMVKGLLHRIATDQRPFLAPSKAGGSKERTAVELGLSMSWQGHRNILLLA
jgi:hypothetical protein